MSNPDSLAAIIDSDLLTRSLDEWGIDVQVWLAVEEFSEVLEVLSEINQGGSEPSAMAEETADALIMAHQLTLCFDIEHIRVLEAARERGEPDSPMWFAVGMFSRTQAALSRWWRGRGGSDDVVDTILPTISAAHGLAHHFDADAVEREVHAKQERLRKRLP